MKQTCIAILAAGALLASHAASIVETDRVELTGITDVKIEGLCLDIRIRGTDSDTVRFEGNDVSDALDVRCEKSGSRLVVKVSRLKPLAPFACSGSLAFSLPRATTVRVKDGSGSIAVSGLRSTEIEASSRSGSIAIGNCTAVLRLTSASGSVQVSNCSGQKDIATASGSVTVSGSRGSLNVTTASGSHDYENTTGLITARTASGRVDIENHTGQLNVKTISGSIDGEHISFTGNSSLESTAGRIDMEFDTDLDSLTFDLHSTAGSLEVGETEAGRSLITGKGPIRVTGRTVSGSQSYSKAE